MGRAQPRGDRPLGQCPAGGPLTGEPPKLSWNVLEMAGLPHFFKNTTLGIAAFQRQREEEQRGVWNKYHFADPFSVPNAAPPQVACDPEGRVCGTGG